MFGQLLFVVAVVGVGEAKGPADAYFALAQWDSNWYAHIVEHGYRSSLPPKPQDKEDSNVAFLPGYPCLARGLGRFFGLDAKSALLVTAQLCCWAFWTYLLRFFQRWRVPTAVVLIAVGTVYSHPCAFFLVAGYSESLFLMALLGYFYWSERGEHWAWPLAALHGFVMTATRIVGVPLSWYPMFVAWRHSAAKPLPQRLLALIPALLLMVVAGLGVLSFFAYCQWRWGQWNLYMETQRIGWDVNPDYLGLFDLTNARLYTPYVQLDDWGAHGLSRFSVPVMLSVFCIVIVLEWSVRRRMSDSGLGERMGFYLSALIMFYMCYTSQLHVETPQELRSLVRYMFPVHVMLALGLTHLACRVPIAPGRRTVMLAALMTYNLIALALETWLISLFTRGSWVG
ncbi:MAG: hypothetical protein K2R98_05150 [Gemmataceae bacterium]|nr:hypothetical protein [Gemmataceae bacterium]